MSQITGFQKYARLTKNPHCWKVYNKVKRKVKEMMWVCLNGASFLNFSWH